MDRPGAARAALGLAGLLSLGVLVRLDSTENPDCVLEALTARARYALEKDIEDKLSVACRAEVAVK